MSSKFLDENGLLYFWQQLKTLLAGKVNTEAGKGLSTNDFTNADQTKLTGIAAGAEVNVINGITVNGTAAPVTNKVAAITTPTKTSELTNDSGYITAAEAPEISVDSALSDTSTNPVQNKVITTALGGYLTIADAQSTYAKKEDIVGMYKYKGSVASVSDLPTNAAIGDVYNVTATGENYAWNGTEWDDIGGTFTIEAITNADIDTIMAS